MHADLLMTDADDQEDLVAPARSSGPCWWAGGVGASREEQRLARAAALVGYVEAPDAEQAIREAITRYEISKPHEQGRLAAQRVKEINLAT